MIKDLSQRAPIGMSRDSRRAVQWFYFSINEAGARVPHW